MAQFFPASAGTYNLNSSIGSTDTSFTLSSFLLPVSGVQITMALLNSAIGYGTIAPKTSSAELISFTGITANADGTSTLTGVTRGLNKTYPYTSSSTFKLPHSGQSIFILSDAPQVFNQYASTSNDQTFAGVNTFTQSPIVPDPLSALQVANKEYVDNIALAGAPNASTTVKGVGEVSVAPVSPTTPIFIGQNDPVVPTQGENDALVGNNTDIAVGTGNKFVTQTGFQKGAELYGASSTGNDTYVVTLPIVPTSYDNGRHYFVKVDVGNTGPATINFNSLGAISIVTGLSTALVTGDMVANGIYELIYNSTGPVFQLVNPASVYLFTPVFTSGTTSKNLADASTTQTIAHGLGRIPKYIRIKGWFIVTASTFGSYQWSEATYNGTTQSGVNYFNAGSNSLTLDTSGTFIITDDTPAGGARQTGVITFDATNINIVWTKASSPTGSYTFLWEAMA